MKRFLVPAAIAAGMIGSSANAALLNVELWDVLAGPSTCCSANPTPDAQKAARTVATTDTVLDNLASPFSANYLPAVNAIIGGQAADFTFQLDSALLVGGFSASGLTGLSTGTDKSLNDFFGFDIDGAGAGIGENSLLGTILRITGFVDVTNGDGYSVRSDDGYSIQIGDATLVENDGLQAPTTTPHSYDGTTGIQAFEMIWFENQRTKAALEVDGLEFTEVPLPAGLPLLLAGLGGLAVLRRRKG